MVTSSSPYCHVYLVCNLSGLLVNNRFSNRRQCQARKLEMLKAKWDADDSDETPDGCQQMTDCTHALTPLIQFNVTHKLRSKWLLCSIRSDWDRNGSRVSPGMGFGLSTHWISSPKFPRGVVFLEAPIVDHAPVLYSIAAYNDWLRQSHEMLAAIENEEVQARAANLRL